MSKQVAAVPTPRPTAQPVWEQYRARLDSYATPRSTTTSRARASTPAPPAGASTTTKPTCPPKPPARPRPPAPSPPPRTCCAATPSRRPTSSPAISTPPYPLEKRVMVLRAHFLVFNFYFGVRVSEVTDEACPRHARRDPSACGATATAPSKATSKKGQIDFTIHKNLTSGAVQFRIHAVSQPGQIRNPFYWVGFKLFGRAFCSASLPASRCGACASWWRPAWPGSRCWRNLWPRRRVRTKYQTESRTSC